MGKESDQVSLCVDSSRMGKGQALTLHQKLKISMMRPQMATMTEVMDPIIARHRSGCSHRRPLARRTSDQGGSLIITHGQASRVTQPGETSQRCRARYRRFKHSKQPLPRCRSYTRIKMKSVAVSSADYLVLNSVPQRTVPQRTVPTLLPTEYIVRTCRRALTCDCGEGPQCHSTAKPLEQARLQALGAAPAEWTSLESGQTLEGTSLSTECKYQVIPSYIPLGQLVL